MFDPIKMLEKLPPDTRITFARFNGALEIRVTFFIFGPPFHFSDSYDTEYVKGSAIDHEKLFIENALKCFKRHLNKHREEAA